MTTQGGNAVNTLRRPFGQLVVIVLMLVSLMAAVPLGVSAQGSNEAAEVCKEGGYLNWTTKPGGEPFTNTGECVSYAALGNTLVPVVVKPYIFLERYDETTNNRCGYTVIGANPEGYTRYWFESIGGHRTFTGYIELYYAEPRSVLRDSWPATNTEYTVTFTVYENRHAEDPKIFVTSATLTFVC